MARYRVQGPDGAIHVFEGPEGASPEDVTAFAQQTFGSKPAATPAAPAASTITADDPGIGQTLLIGAGRTFDRIGKGAQQMYYGASGNQPELDRLKQQSADDDAAYAPLQAKRPWATAIGEALPSVAIPVGGGATVGATVGRLALAGGLPGALEYGSAGDRAERALGGAAAGVAGGVIAPKVGQAIVRAVPAVGRTARAIAEPLYQGGREAIAGRTLNSVAGDSAPGVIQKLQAAAPLVPGSLPTVGQVAESGGLAALERSMAASLPEEFSRRAMDQSGARLQALRGIAGDDATRAAAVEARAAATDPLYQQAKGANYTVDSQLADLLQRPTIKEAMTGAQRLAADNGRPFAFNTPSPPHGEGAVRAGAKQVTGQGLQDLKMSLDAMLKAPSNGIAGAEASTVKGLRGQLLDWMEGANPEFKTARTTFSEMSKPINQMDIGQNLLQRIEPALADYGALGKESGAKYAQALRNADQTARQATGFKGAGMADIMSPEQMATLNAVGADLGRKANAQDLGRGIGSDTFQKLALSNIAAQSGAPRVLGGAMALPGVSKVAKFLYAEPEQKIQSLIAKSLLDPQTAAQLMMKNAPQAPANLRQLLLSNPNALTQIGGGAAGLSLGNYLAQ